MTSKKASEAPAPKTISVSLTRAAVDILKNVITSKWSDDALQMVRVYELLENQMNVELPKGPKAPRIDNPRNPSVAEQEAVEAYNAAYEEWATPRTTFDIPEAVYQDVKACLKMYVKQKAFDVTKHTVNLFTEFNVTGA